MYLRASVFIHLISTLLATPLMQHPTNDESIETNKITAEGVIKLNKRAFPPAAFQLGTDLLLRGLEASRNLLRGATLRNAVGPVREYEKFGDRSQALSDFHKVRPTDIQIFKTPNGAFGKMGKVGDRNIVYVSRNDKGLPTVEITKFRNLQTKVKGEVPNMPDPLLTDRIVYTRYFP